MNRDEGPVCSILAQDNGVPRFMKGYLDRQKVLDRVDREGAKIAGVRAYVYTPKAAIPAVNRDRVLIDLHSGGFSGCLPFARVFNAAEPQPVHLTEFETYPDWTATISTLPRCELEVVD